MHVSPIKAQSVKEGDLLIFNEGDDRRFTIGKVISVVKTEGGSPALTTYKFTMTGIRGAVATYYKNETVDRAVLS